ncbi:carotenoid oxygenase family protein [Bradyrhizobium manausense]
MPEPVFPSKGFYGPVPAFRFEADIRDCEVIGQLPRDLIGAYFRVGGDRAYPSLEDDVLINGDGIMSMFRFEDGGVDYRCRYVETERLRHERRVRRRLYGKYRNEFTDDASTTGTDRDNTANTYAFSHHGRLFALREDSHPTEIDPRTLQTLGTWNCGNRLKSKTMTAHPKIDPDTGEWWSYGLFAYKRYEGEMNLQVIDRNGRLIREEEFMTPYPGISHDFAITEQHIIFPIMPLTVDMRRVKQGGDFYAYDPDLAPVYGIMPRSGSVSEIRWFKAPGAFMAHVMNAYSEGHLVHLDAPIARGNSFGMFRDVSGHQTDPTMGIPTISRLTFDLKGGDVSIKPFPGSIGEMPRCDERFTSKRYRYGFHKSRDGIVRIDWQNGERSVYATPNAPGGAQEPVFVPRAPDAREGEGFVVCLVNVDAENRAELVVIDAEKMTEGPVATIRLPFNQPQAFHGCFVSE